MAGMAIHKFVRSAAVALVLLASQCAATAQVDRAAAEDLMRKSGLWEQIASIAPAFETGFIAAAAKARVPLPADEQGRLVKVIATAYAPAHLRAVALAVLADGLKPQEASEVAEWYRSPLGNSIGRMEEASSADNGGSEAKLREGMGLFSKASGERQALLKQLVQVTRSPEAGMQMVVDTTLAIQQGLAAAQPSLPGPSPAELRAALEKQRPQMLQGFAGMTAVLFARTYAKLSDDELQQYIAFLSGAAGARYTELGMEGLQRALRDGALEFGRGLPGAKARANP
jgi:hypothetical protein